ncbi:MAG TPA: hypothetical protein VEB60_01375 [Candidatus Paceibacterota bacterium]|nr:hypothetical protein [Candidatus Paceibacterota bacterium]
MVNVQFNESHLTVPRVTAQNRGMAGWLVKKEIAKNLAQANIILITASVCLLLASFFLLFSGQKEEAVVTEQDVQNYINSFN